MGPFLSAFLQCLKSLDNVKMQTAMASSWGFTVKMQTTMPPWDPLSPPGMSAWVKWRAWTFLYQFDIQICFIIASRPWPPPLVLPWSLVSTPTLDVCIFTLNLQHGAILVCIFTVSQKFRPCKNADNNGLKLRIHCKLYYWRRCEEGWWLRRCMSPCNGYFGWVGVCQSL